MEDIHELCEGIERARNVMLYAPADLTEDHISTLAGVGLERDARDALRRAQLKLVEAREKAAKVPTRREPPASGGLTREALAALTTALAPPIRDFLRAEIRVRDEKIAALDARVSVLERIAPSDLSALAERITVLERRSSVH